MQAHMHIIKCLRLWCDPSLPSPSLSPSPLPPSLPPLSLPPLSLLPLPPSLPPQQAIQRVAKPGSEEVYTVVNKSAPGVKAFQVTPRDPSPPAPPGKEGKGTDPPYVNQSSIPSTDRPVVYRKSITKVYIYFNT